FISQVFSSLLLNDGIEEQVEENTCEINADDDSCNFICFAQLLILSASQQNKQFSHGDIFGEDDWDRHKDDQVPWLIGGKQLHVVGHCCFHACISPRGMMK